MRPQVRRNHILPCIQCPLYLLGRKEVSRTELPLTGPQILQSDFAELSVVLHIKTINIINYCRIQISVNYGLMYITKRGDIRINLQFA